MEHRRDFFVSNHFRPGDKAESGAAERTLQIRRSKREAEKSSTISN